MIVKKLKLVCLTHSGSDASGMVADNVDNEIVQVCSSTSLCEFKYAQKKEYYIQSMSLLLLLKLFLS